MAASAISACGDGAGDATAPSPSAPSTATTSTSVLPATTLFDPSSSVVQPIGSIEPVEVTEPCPEQDADVPAGGAITEEMAKLEPMLGIVLAYGGEHPDQFGSYGLVWHAQTDASVVLAMTGDLATHRAVIEGMVAHPDEVVVCQAAYSAEQRPAVEAELRADDRVRSVGAQGFTYLQVGLASSAEDLAPEIIERYGDGVQVKVGAFAYPIDPATEAVCPDRPDVGLPGLDITVDQASVPAGSQDHLELTATITNTSGAAVRLEDGPVITGTLLDAAGRPVSTVGEMASRLSLETRDLAPGASTTWPVAVGLASCDPALGYALPPGDYSLVVDIGRSDGRTASAPIPFRLD